MKTLNLVVAILCGSLTMYSLANGLYIAAFANLVFTIGNATSDKQLCSSKNRSLLNATTNQFNMKYLTLLLLFACELDKPCKVIKVDRCEYVICTGGVATHKANCANHDTLRLNNRTIIYTIK